MERYKVIFQYKYGRSFKYTDIVRAESSKEEMIAKIAVETQGFTVISKISEMLEG